MKNRIFVLAGIVPVIAALFVMTLAFGHPVAVLGDALGFTPTFTPPPTDTPSVTNTPTGNGTPTSTPGESDTPISQNTPAPESHLSVTKSARPAQVLPGGQVVFTIQACNTGDGTADRVVVSDALPPELTLLSAYVSQGEVVVEGNGMRAELGALLAGECASVTLTAQVRADVAPGTEIRNVASVGDTYDDTTITIVGLLPESGRAVSLAEVALLMMGAGLLAIGMAKSRAVFHSRPPDGR